MAKRWKIRPELLLLPRIPKPLHGMNPRTALGATWWNQTRKAAYARTNYHCEACGIRKEDTKKKQLEGHEVYDIDYLEGTSTYIEATPLCNTCHNYIHQGRLNALLQMRKITYQRFQAVITHGDRVLMKAGLDPRERNRHEEMVEHFIVNNMIALWPDWRLKVDLTEERERVAVYNKHHKTAPRGSTYIGRGSKWGNPYKVGEDGDRDKVIELFLQERIPDLDLKPLLGKNLVCYCAPKRCHGDVILDSLYRPYEFRPLYDSETDYHIANGLPV